MDRRGRDVIFTVGGSPYSRADVVSAAQRWGDWASLEEQTRRGIACLKRTGDTAEALAARELEVAAEEFRYDRDLITGQEMEAWLAAWKLTVDDWTDYLRRSVLRHKWASALREIVARYPPTAEEVDRSIDAEAICSGFFLRAAHKLAGRLAVYARAREEGRAPALDAHADTERLLEHLDDAFHRFREEILTADRLEHQIASHQLDWIRIDGAVIAFADEQGAREAALCVRDDGMALDEVAARARAGVRETTVYVEQIEPDVRSHFVGARPGDLVGPLACGGEVLLALVRDKVLPSLDDPDVRRRAEERLLKSAVEHELTNRVRWTRQG